MENYIGISDKRLRHSLGVARKAYKIAKADGYEESYCRRMFMLGFVHDVGYEFAKNPEEHPDVGADMLKQLAEDCEDAILAIKEHGQMSAEKTDEWRILNMADMLTNSDGRDVDATTRLNDIKARYGKHSKQYLMACEICHQTMLLKSNPAQKPKK